ncbi:Protein of unknown function [Pyronema omphalodes CBS 100304]|uniref:Uncharacterized protein n=1 Tax=Pyronema omphalodes (strain CBS 100304) TaxID=1076935 RepID=U4LVS0_PYROM|nr:Protein of unknown function [Pyronema omphalodes CBS 100304]
MRVGPRRWNGQFFLPFLLLFEEMERRKAEQEEIEQKAKQKGEAERRARNEKWERERWALWWNTRTYQLMILMIDS